MHNELDDLDRWRSLCRQPTGIRLPCSVSCAASRKPGKAQQHQLLGRSRSGRARGRGRRRSGLRWCRVGACPCVAMGRCKRRQGEGRGLAFFRNEATKFGPLGVPIGIISRNDPFVGGLGRPFSSAATRALREENWQARSSVAFWGRHGSINGGRGTLARWGERRGIGALLEDDVLAASTCHRNPRTSCNTRPTKALCDHWGGGGCLPNSRPP